MPLPSALSQIAEGLDIQDGSLRRQMPWRSACHGEMNSGRLYSVFEIYSSHARIFLLEGFCDVVNQFIFGVVDPIWTHDERVDANMVAPRQRILPDEKGA